MLSLFLGWALVPMIILVSTGEPEYYVGTKGDYDSAEMFCHSRGMTMVQVSNVDLMTSFGYFLLGQSLPGADIWIGLQHNGFSDPTDFRWPDGTLMAWSNWGDLDASYPMEPNYLDTDHCVAVVMSNLNWYSRPCSDYNYIACQQPNLGPHFSRLEGQNVIGHPMAEVMGFTGPRCAAYCLRVNFCHVIQIHTNGTCALFNLSTVSLLSSPNKDYLRTYQRQRKRFET